MLYEIYLENGWTPWLAFQTTDKEKAHAFLASARAQYIYFRVLDEKGTIVHIHTHHAKIENCCAH